MNLVKDYERYAFNRRWSNASLMRYRYVDAHIVSMQQSGTHWLKNMLAYVLRKKYNLPDIEHIQDNAIIGHTKTPPKYKHIPKIIHSHGYPHALTFKVPFIYYPKYVVLLRGLKESLVSHFERFGEKYYGDTDFSEYLRGDIKQKKFNSDIYTRIRFMNEWGAIQERHPDKSDKVKVVRYEDLKASPAEQLYDLCRYLNLDASPELCAEAAMSTTKEKMAKNSNPEMITNIVRLEHKPMEEFFTPENEAVFNDICAQLLRYDFGYGYPLARE